MAVTAKTITVSKAESTFKTLFSKIQRVQYYAAGEITKALLATGIETVALPVLEDSVSMNTGDADVSEINILDGTVWTSKSTKGDSDISMQVASVDDAINSIFMTKKIESGSAWSTGDVIYNSKTYEGVGYTLDVKKATGGLILSDDTGDNLIILPSVEMTGSLVVADGDNPAYFNVKITPSVNKADGVSIMILKKKS